MSLQKYAQQTAADRKVAFESHQSSLRVRTNNACRYTTLYCIFFQYLKHLERTDRPADGPTSIQLVEAAIQQLRESNPNFITSADASRLLLELQEAGRHTAGLIKEKIKRSFLVELPQILVTDQSTIAVAELIEQDIEDNDLYSDELPASATLDQVQLNEQTHTWVDGYYDQVSGVVKASCSNAWFKQL